MLTRMQFEERRRHRDQLLNGMTADGCMRVAVINTTATVNEAQRRFNMSRTALSLLGRAMSAAALLNSFMKGEERLVIDMSGDGGLGRVVVESIRVGEIRGYVQHPNFELSTANGLSNNGSHSLGDAIRPGVLMVRKIMYNKSLPVDSTVGLVSGDVQGDLEEYFNKSEQIPTALVVDTKIDQLSRNAIYSFGVFVQALPETPASMIDSVTKKMRQMMSSPQQLQELLASIIRSSAGDETDSEAARLVDFDVDRRIRGMGITDYLVNESGIVPSLDTATVRKTPIDFFCRCSRESFMESLLQIGKTNLHELRESTRDTGGLELRCEFCNNRYTITDDHFEVLEKRLNEPTPTSSTTTPK